MSYVAIGSAIEQMVDEVTEISVVFSFPDDTFDEFPCARVRMRGHENEFRTTAANIRKFFFYVDLMYKTQNSQDAEAILRDVTDKVIAKLESDVTLRGTCHIARPSRGEVQYLQEPIPMQVVTLTIEATKHINR